MQLFTLEVNGQQRRVISEPDTPLLYVLRNDLNLKGVNYGCGSEQCGACKVLVDGQAVPTCKLPVKNAAGLPITTIEGLGTPGNLHHLQQAFIEGQAFQCGYCTPGMILAAKGLLNQTRYPSDDEIREGLEKNLCRCGVYDRVRSAIKLATGRPDRYSRYEVRAAPGDTPSPGDFPATLVQTPDLDAWLRINRDGTITVITGKVELGQGIKTAAALIVAEELDVSVNRIHVAPTDSSYSPDEGLTVSSMSLETTGVALRWAAAEARHIMLSVAYEELEAPLERLEVSGGTNKDPFSGRSTDYWQLFGGKTFARLVTGTSQPKSGGQYTLLGKRNPRLDSAAKVSGQTVFIHDLDLPGMVHARILRPPNQSAVLISFDQSLVEGMPGTLKVIQDGSFLGVICEQEPQAVRALERLQQAAQWGNQAQLPDQDRIIDDLVSQPGQSYLVKEGKPVEDKIPPVEIPAEAAQTLDAT